VPGIDLAGYQQTLLERFANPKIRDQVARICTDGSDRMPKFLLPSLAEALQQGRPHRLLTLAVAGWLRYLRGVDEAGQEIAIADRLSGELRARANEGRDDPRPVLSLRSIFGELGRDEAFVAELAAALRELDASGAKATLSAYLATSPA
jgi:fructuronate reductase/mannitol 2-dehydrogenase